MNDNQTWHTAPLKYHTHINAETLPETTPSDYELEYIDIGSVNSQGEITSTQHMKFEYAPSRARRVVRNGDTIVSTVRTYLKAIAYIGEEKENLICSTGFAVLTPHEGIKNKFLAYFSRSNYFIDEIVSRSVGVSYPAVNASDIANIKVLIPPFNEQERIVYFLDRELAVIDNMVRKKERLIKLLQEKRQAIINEAVTKGLDPNVPMKDSGIEWLGNVPAHWRISKFKYISKLTSGGTPKRNNNVDYFENGDIDWVRTLDLTEDSVFDTSEKLTEEALMNSNCKMLPVNTLLIAMYGGGGTIGKSGILEIESTTNQAIASILPNEKYFYPRYLLRVLNFLRPHWMIYAEGSRKDPNINLDVVANMPLPLPPINEQKKISLFLEKKLISLANIELKIIKQIKQLQEYRQSLISEAVTGKIDIGE